MILPAFWIPESEQVFRATIHTQGPWNPQFQHGGPPAALLVRQMEQCAPRPEMVLARVTIDMLGPIPLATLRATARLVRPGRKVELLEASLEYEGRTLMRATGWRIQAPSARPEVKDTGNALRCSRRSTRLPPRQSGSAAVFGLCCKKSERNAGGVQSHVPVQLRQPLQTGWR